jgi:hypothetical protein
LQAMPWGAEIVPLAPFLGDPDVVWLHGWHPLDAAQRAALPGIAEGLVGTPYGFGDYVSLILVALRVRPAWLRRRIASDRRLICSQTVDLVMRELGEHLFADGRISADVTPGDLHIQATIDHSRTGCPAQTGGHSG